MFIYEADQNSLIDKALYIESNLQKVLSNGKLLKWIKKSIRLGFLTILIAVTVNCVKSILCSQCDQNFE